MNWLGGNWISSGYHQYYTSRTGVWNETAAIIAGPDTGVLAAPGRGDFYIPSGSPLIDAGVSLPASITTNHDIVIQYAATRTYAARADVDDIGAFIYGSGGEDPTCSDGIQNGDETGVDCGGSCSPCLTLCYLDADGDRYSDGTSETVETCSAHYYTAAQLSATSGDCDDSNPEINPDATEEPGNGIDEDCDGADQPLAPQPPSNLIVG